MRHLILFHSVTSYKGIVCLSVDLFLRGRNISPLFISPFSFVTTDAISAEIFSLTSTVLGNLKNIKKITIYIVADK